MTSPFPAERAFEIKRQNNNRIAFTRDRLCTVCKRHLPASKFFVVRNRYPFKRDSRCGDCRTVLRRENYANGKYHYPEKRLRRTKWKRGIKTWARQVVKEALKSGKLQRQPCEECKALRSHAHHEDYQRPLDVNWLCCKHHAMRHWKPVNTPIAQ